jgi:hypothetical protein
MERLPAHAWVGKDFVSFFWGDDNLLAVDVVGDQEDGNRQQRVAKRGYSLGSTWNTASAMIFAPQPFGWFGYVR